MAPTVPISSRPPFRGDGAHPIGVDGIRREITLHYQPQVDSLRGNIIGVETLMRWTRLGDGVISPTVFIPLAEETGVIGALGVWLLQEACREAATCPAPISIAVNISPVQFRLGDFVATVRAALAASGLRPSRLELEGLRA